MLEIIISASELKTAAGAAHRRSGLAPKTAHPELAALVGHAR
jgi:hypothetical protein